MQFITQISARINRLIKHFVPKNIKDKLYSKKRYNILLSFVPKVNFN